MTEIARKEPGVAELAAFPTLANVARSLQWLRREIPLEPSRILDCYDLLYLPCLEDGASDMVARASRLTSLLQQAIELVTDSLHRLVLHEMLLSGAQDSAISTRLRSAKAKAIEADLLGANTSEKTLGEIESHAITNLARVLLSQSFASEVGTGQVVSARADAEPEDSGFGYVWLSRSTRLCLYPAEPLRQTYIRSLRLRATSHETRVVMHRFYWSGGGSVPVPQVLSTEHGHTWLGTRPETGDFSDKWYVSFFHLGKVLQRGDEAELEWSEAFTDTYGNFQNALTGRARFSNIKYLRFELTGLQPGVAYRVLGGAFHLDGARLIPVGELETITVDPNGIYSYEAKDKTLKRGLRYGLRWEVQ